MLQSFGPSELDPFGNWTAWHHWYGRAGPVQCAFIHGSWEPWHSDFIEDGPSGAEAGMTQGQDPILGMFAAGRFEPYIRYIRFPHFRNLRDGTHIDFGYPITVLVGPNGTGKTAILRALQGCPTQTNVGLYWFSTSLDPISDGISEEDRHRYIYGYYAQSVGHEVEVIKSRITRRESGDPRRRQDDPDYFETARPILADGMAPMPPSTRPRPADRTATRWRPIQKRVTYLDFRAELSAFDKFFFHTPLTKRITSLSDKKRMVRQRARHIAASMDGRSSYTLYGSERIIEPAHELTNVQVGSISQILGREYESIKVLRHRFFNEDGYTVLLRSRYLSYSEAFAGSGEFAVTMLVRGITQAPERSLVLLDEPEVSLHPGAQRGLMEFIRNQAKERCHQFVLSTQAPEIVRDLPDQAIKVFQEDQVDGKIRLISQTSSPSEAFVRLGVPTDKRRIYVEDKLAALIVRRAIRLIGGAAYAQIEIQPLPGGAGIIQTRQVPSFALSGADCLVFLDGDQRVDRPPPSADLPDSALEETAKELLHGEPQLSLSGGVGGYSPTEKRAQLRAIIAWVREHVDYLPGEDPESLLFELMGEDPPPGGAVAAKKEWVARTRTALGKEDYENVTSADILQEQDRALARVEDSSETLQAISERLRRFLH
jgi:ABC-type Mn2+/Zn2+ transport system ATPase subunit